ncbi:MAG TPA: RcnB family protein [Allosphingosinicella sp.]|jgi:Ni/Co efflux regulator RcnB
MTKLYLLALAAGAAILPAAASAQSAPHAGHSWREGTPVAVSPPVVLREMRQMHRGPDGRHGGRFTHIPRIRHGGFVPGGWWGPQFVIRNWQGYGFPQPFNGGRWIRYYDDALLIDRDGRVHDSRYGYDWDRYGDRWGYDGRGVPIYVGDGDYEPRDRDYDRDYRRERHGRDVVIEHRNYRGPPPMQHGYSYGYGCGCGPVVVTETTTTTAPVVEQVTTYEYVTEYVTTKAKPKKRRIVRRAPAPAPARPGERG